MNIRLKSIAQIATISLVLTMGLAFTSLAEETGPGTVVQVIEETQQQEVGPGVSGSSGGAYQPAAGTAFNADGTVNMNGIDLSRPMVAITFDDGPSTDNTTRLLSVIEMYGARATFFVVGNRLKGREAILQRAVADGCEIGNHSYAHENLHKANHNKTVQTLTATSDAIQAITGVRPIIMRPPGGAIDAATLGTVGSLGMSSILWSVDTLDWKTRNAQATIDCVLSKVKDGDVILMHDIHSPTVDAAGIIIPELINRGYQLVTVSQLATARGGLVPGGNYNSFRP